MAKLAVIKTTESNASVEDFINSMEPEQKRKDCFTLIQLMQAATGAPPKMWGNAIIGFGNVIAKSPATGREVAWFTIGFSPRKAALTLYLPGNSKAYEALLPKLGKYKTSGGCLYINKLADVNMQVLQDMIEVTLTAKG